MNRVATIALVVIAINLTFASLRELIPAAHAQVDAQYVKITSPVSCTTNSFGKNVCAVVVVDRSSITR